MKTEEHPEEVRGVFISEMVKSKIKMLGYPNRHRYKDWETNEGTTDKTL